MEQTMTKLKTSAVKKDAAAKAKEAGPTKGVSKLGQLEAMLRHPEGGTIAQLSKALDWQTHGIRGAMSGSLKKKRELQITAAKGEGADRIYRIVG
jgi:hypothetical protein